MYVFSYFHTKVRIGIFFSKRNNICPLVLIVSISKSQDPSHSGFVTEISVITLDAILCCNTHSFTSSSYFVISRLLF